MSVWSLVHVRSQPVRAEVRGSLRLRRQCLLIYPDGRVCVKSDKYKSVPCKSYNGSDCYCPFGTRCDFLHNGATPAKRVVAPSKNDTSAVSREASTAAVARENESSERDLESVCRECAVSKSHGSELMMEESSRQSATRLINTATPKQGSTSSYASLYIKPVKEQIRSQSPGERSECLSPFSTEFVFDTDDSRSSTPHSSVDEGEKLGGIIQPSAQHVSPCTERSTLTRLF